MATDPTTPSSTQSVFDDENLLTEILLRLPTIPLISFKSICKRWNSIISSDSFTRLHTHLFPPNTSPTSGVFLRRSLPVSDSNSFNYHFLSLPSGPLSQNPFQFQFSSPSPKLLQSCNGLMLFSTRNCYVIYNPSTSQFKELPILTLALSAHILGVSLGFDPSRFDGFRVICLATTDSSDYSYRIFTYCSPIGSWKDWEGNPFNAPFDVNFSSCVYCNGGFHWISLSEDSIYFDIESGKLGRFPSPPISLRMRGYRQFCEFNGKLHYVDVDEYRSPVCKIFTLAGYDECWIVEYNVYVPEMVIGEGHGFSMLCLVWNWNHGEERRMEMVVHVRNKILAYDLEKMTWRTICDSRIGDRKDSSSSSDRLQFGCFDACSYAATFALF